MMKTQNSELHNTLRDEKELIFYKIMKYPVPKQFSIFLCDEKKRKQTPQTVRLGNFKEE
ncbi:MAG: hypothetical protein WCJ39_08880 [bacterium]